MDQYSKFNTVDQVYHKDKCFHHCILNSFDHQIYVRRF